MQNDLPPFEAILRKFPGKGGWTYIIVPESHAPKERMAFGRCPVKVTIKEQTWESSVWQEKSGRCILSLPKKNRGSKEKGESIEIKLEYPFQKTDPDNYRKFI